MKRMGKWLVAFVFIAALLPVVSMQADVGAAESGDEVQSVVCEMAAFDFQDIMYAEVFDDLQHGHRCVYVGSRCVMTCWRRVQCGSLYCQVPYCCLTDPVYYCY